MAEIDARSRSSQRGVASSGLDVLRRRVQYGVGSLGGAAVLLVALEVVTRLGLIPARVFPPPSVVIGTLAGELSQATFWWAIAQTMLGWALGLGVACLIAIPVGVLLASSEMAYRATRPIVEFLRPIPSVALIPLAFLLFQPGIEGKVFLAAFGALWPLLIQTIYGVRNIQPLQLATARSFQIRRRDVFAKVIVPASIPYIATGLRISSTVALILAITAEIVMGAPGIGLEINRAREGGATESMYAYLIVAGMIGLTLNSAFARLESHVLHWHASQRDRNA